MSGRTNAIDPRIVGVNGDLKRVDAIAQAYGVIVANRPNVQGRSDLDHSVRLYLVDPENRLGSDYDPDEAVADIVYDIERRLKG